MMQTTSKIDLILNEMMTENKKDTEMGHNIKISSVLTEFGVDSEDDFSKVMETDWNIIVCSCKNKIDIVTAKYTSNGDIQCGKCGKLN